MGCFYSACIRKDTPESIQVVPNFLIISMEDVRAISMNLNSGVHIPLGVAVACEVRPLVNHYNRVTPFSQFSRDNRATEPCSNAKIAVHFEELLHVV